MSLGLVGFLPCTDHPRTKNVRGSGSRLETACAQCGNGTDRGHDAINVGHDGSDVKVEGRDRRQRLTKPPAGLGLLRHVDVPETYPWPPPRRNLDRRPLTPRSGAWTRGPGVMKSIEHSIRQGSGRVDVPRDAVFIMRACWPSHRRSALRPHAVEHDLASTG